MTRLSQKEKCCPYWDKYSKRSCQLIASGLFIPTRNHILQFCENESFVKCYHYVGKKESSLLEHFTETQDEKRLTNRRHYTRIPTTHKVSVSQYSIVKDVKEDILDNQAMAVDLSIGGMRIETSVPLNVNQIVSFSFDEHFKPPNYKGRGEVRWIYKDNSEDVQNHAGLAFVDNDSQRIIRTHLLGLGDKLLRLSGF